MLSIYGQYYPHDDAIIAGTKESLARFAKLISTALEHENQRAKDEFFDLEGEGYSIKVVSVDQNWEELPPPYDFDSGNMPSCRKNVQDNKSRNIFGFVVAHESQNSATRYLDSNICEAPTFASHKKGARVYSTISDICIHLCSQFSGGDGRFSSLSPAEYRIIPFQSEADYKEWVTDDKSNLFSVD
jgi:hypothetical protein